MFTFGVQGAEVGEREREMHVAVAQCKYFIESLLVSFFVGLRVQGGECLRVWLVVLTSAVRRMRLSYWLGWLGFLLAEWSFHFSSYIF